MLSTPTTGKDDSKLSPFTAPLDSAVAKVGAGFPRSYQLLDFFNLEKKQQYFIHQAMTIIKANNLSLGDVHRLLGFQMEWDGSFTPLLSLEPLTEFEQQELQQIRVDFRSYLTEGKISEGLVKALTIFPLIRLAGFYRPPIKISLEEDIADIVIEDEDKKITGRMDILAVNKISKTAANTSLWILVIESKNTGVNASEGLPQLLTYAYQSLERQKSVWGLTTNGMHYQFVYIENGSTLTYQLMPFLNLLELQPSVQLLQVFKAICKQPN